MAEAAVDHDDAVARLHGKEDGVALIAADVEDVDLTLLEHAPGAMEIGALHGRGQRAARHRQQSRERQGEYR